MAHGFDWTSLSHWVRIVPRGKDKAFCQSRGVGSGGRHKTLMTRKVMEHLVCCSCLKSSERAGAVAGHKKRASIAQGLVSRWNG